MSARAHALAAASGTHFERSSEDASWTTADALPRHIAEQLVADLTASGIEASDAPDHDDRSLRWVHVTLDEVQS